MASEMKEAIHQLIEKGYSEDSVVNIIQNMIKFVRVDFAVFFSKYLHNFFRAHSQSSTASNSSGS